MVALEKLAERRRVVAEGDEHDHVRPTRLQERRLQVRQQQSAFESAARAHRWHRGGWEPHTAHRFTSLRRQPQSTSAAGGSVSWLADVVSDATAARGGQRQQRTARVGLSDGPEHAVDAEIVSSEVVRPGGDAVRLVYHEQSNAPGERGRLEQRSEERGEHLLRRHEEDL